MGLTRRIIELFDAISSLEEFCDRMDRKIARMEEESDFGGDHGWSNSLDRLKKYWQRNKTRRLPQIMHR